MERGVALDNPKKVQKLFDYIRQVCDLRQQLVRHIDAEPWRLFLDELPIDPKRIHRYDPSDEMHAGVLLEVEKPAFSPCPEIPFELIGWLRTHDWKNFETAEVEAYDARQRRDARLGDVTERFVDDGVRLAAFEDWKRRRTLWRAGEVVKSRTQQLFMALYDCYDRCRKDAERVELVIGNGSFLNGLDTKLDHPILVRQVRLVYDARGMMQLVETGQPTEVYADLFQDLPGIDPAAVRDFAGRVDEASVHPLDADLPAFLEEQATALTPNCRFAAKRFELLPTDWYLLYPRPVLFLRRRSTGTGKAVQAILEEMAHGGELPQPLLSLVDDARGGTEDETEVEGNASVDARKLVADARGEAADILLVRPANAEQLAIARRIEEAPAVVVQGPPGTGKTHTIANLLGHFLARGEHVLVTSATSKALSVLKDKLPDGVQNLCVALLDGGRADMERSIAGICDMLARHSADEVRAEAEKLERERAELLARLYELRERVAKIQQVEAMRDYLMIGEEGWSLSRMAEFVRKNAHLAGRIPGTVAPDHAMPLSEAELAELYATNAMFDAASLDDLSGSLPASDAVMSPVQMERAISEKSVMREEEETLLAALPDVSIGADGKLLSRGQEAAGDLAERLLLDADSLYHAIDFDHLRLDWARETILAGRQGGSRREVFEMLGRDIARVQQLKGQAMTQFFGRDLRCTLEEMPSAALIQTLAAMMDAMREDDGLSWLDRLRHRDWIRVQKGFSIDGHAIASRRDCQLAMQYVALKEAREKVRREWAELLVPYGMEPYDKLAERSDDIDDLCSAQFCELSALLDWYPRVFDELMLVWRRAGVHTDAVLPDTAFATPHECLVREVEWLERDFPRWQRLLRLRDAKGSAGDIEATRLALLAATSPLALRMAHAIETGQTEAYATDYAQLLRIERLKDAYARRESLLKRLAPDAPQWAQAIREKEGDCGAAKPPHEAGKAWLVAVFTQQLAAAPDADTAALGHEIERLTEDLHRTTEALVEKRAWQHLLDTVAGSALQSALIGWSKAVTKLGKGKGKYAARHIREARACMREAQRAVPAWIMPLPRVFESLSPDAEKFDVILVDEASQADITSVPLLYFGRKVIIVGDDKQVSPSAVGVPADDVAHLMASTIDGIVPHASLYTMDTSLYDLAQMHYRASMLMEHFRSVPEIIEYSNQLCYDGRIRPLREAGAGALVPLVDCRVAGEREERGRRNAVEAEYIAALLAACIEQPEYRDATFGAISMLGDTQPKLIREIAAAHIGIAELEAHGFLSGTPAHFQGDERDVIFLSFVDSLRPGEDGTLRLVSEGYGGEQARRYNVAVSRARDQVFLVHSMDTTDLKNGDLRRSLFAYAAAGKRAEAPAVREATPFEAVVARDLRKKGYTIREQYTVGSYTIDMVACGGRGKAAIVCDGERFGLTAPAAAEERRREAVLERLGWRFFHLRGSAYYQDPEGAISRLSEELDALGIARRKAGEPFEQPAPKANARQELAARVRARAEEILAAWHEPAIEE